MPHKLLPYLVSPIQSLDKKSAQRLLLARTIVDTYTDGKSADYVYEVTFDATFCTSELGQQLSLSPRKTYILKQSPTKDVETSRLPTEIDARIQLENSSYQSLYTPVHAVFVSDTPQEIPHFMVMEKVDGKTITELFLDETGTEPHTLQDTLGQYTHRFAQAFLETKRKELTSGAQRQKFLTNVTFGLINTRVAAACQKKTSNALYLKKLVNLEKLITQETEYPNPFYLFSEKLRDVYLRELGISQENWHDIELMLQTVEVGMSPSDITPTNIKIQASSKKEEPEHFCYDQGRFAEHSYAYTLCKLMGPFAQLFWFQIACNKFQFEPPTTPLVEATESLKTPQSQPRFTEQEIKERFGRCEENEAFDLTLTAPSKTQKAINTYTQQVLDALEQSYAHNELLRNRPLFRPHLIFYSIRQLLADVPYRVQKDKMKANLICAAILMKKIMLQLNKSVAMLREDMDRKSKINFEDYIRNPDNAEAVRTITDAIILDESV